MAKISGPLAGAMRGKVGQVVAAKTVTGETAIRAYQPQVKNPRTARQISARDRLSVVSYVASCLSTAIGIGYAKAVQGMGMYARNMWIRDFLKEYSAIANDGNEISGLEWPEIAVSKKAGIGIKPTVVITAGQGGEPATARVTNASDVEVNTAVETLGIVLVMPRSDGSTINGEAFIVQSTQMTGIELPAMAASMPCLAFFKKVPNTGTQIQTETTPWKYPSDTSETTYVGSVPA